MQEGYTPAHIASEQGHTEILALLLANKADVNAASEVHQFKIFNYLWVIDNEIEDFNIVFFILSTILAHETWAIILHGSRSFCMQEGATPAFIGSEQGHAETLALLLANKADINAAMKVQQLPIFK